MIACHELAGLADPVLERIYGQNARELLADARRPGGCAPGGPTDFPPSQEKRHEYRPCRRPTSRVLVLSAHSMALDRRIVVEMNSLVARGREVCLVTVPTDLPAEVMDPRILVVGRHQTKDHTYLVSGHCRDGEFRAQSRELPPGVAERIRNAAPSGDLTALYQWFGNYFPILAEGLRNFGLAPRPFDAIHCHDLETLAPALRIRDKLHPGAKLIYDAHELYPYCVPDWHHQSFWSGIELRLIGQADAVITVSDSFADLLASLYHIPKPTVLHNSYGALGEEAHVGEVEFLAHFGAPTGGKRIVFQGGLNQSRNVETLIRASPTCPGPPPLPVPAQGRGPRGPADQGRAGARQRLPSPLGPPAPSAG